MRRAYILILCTVVAVIGVGGYFGVRMVIGALAELAAGVGALLTMFALLALVLIVVLLSGADWFTFVNLVDRMLGLLGML